MKVSNVLKLLAPALAGLVVVGVTLPNMITSERHGSSAAAVQIQGIESALDIYALDHGGRYPTDEYGLLPLIERPPGDMKWRGPYLKGPRVPIDAWGNAVRYEVRQLDDGRARMRISSLGKDKRPIVVERLLDPAPRDGD